MASQIEDYALVGNCETVALVGLDGSIDWLGLPRFDSPACFAALLGSPENGRWLIGPTHEKPKATRNYRRSTLILETTFETPDGAVCVTDFMSRKDGAADLVRVVSGLRGTVAMHVDLVVRFDYGLVVPWVSRTADARLEMIAGPDRLLLDTPVTLRGEDLHTVGEFQVAEGQEIGFVLTWTPSFRPYPERQDPTALCAAADAFWTNSDRLHDPSGEWDDAVIRSVLTLKALAHFETGGIVAAATTSLPEQLGGPRNWDYRFCWLRDATLTLYALIRAGFLDEAIAWREWLLRAVAGSPDRIADHVRRRRRAAADRIRDSMASGLRGSAPVRVGNAAHGQRQLDVYGEVLDALFEARRSGLDGGRSRAGIWNARCSRISRRSGTSRMTASGRYAAGARTSPIPRSWPGWRSTGRSARPSSSAWMAPLDQWTAIRDRIHDEVCRKGFDSKLNSFVQSLWLDPTRREPAHDRRSSAFSRPPTLGSSAPWPRSSAPCYETGSCCATIRGRASTVCRRARAPFLRAAFGLPTTTSFRAGSLKPAPCLRSYSHCATMLACFPKNTTTRRGAWSATSRRLSRTSR